MKKKFEFPEIDIIKFDLNRVLFEESGWGGFPDDDDDFGGGGGRPRPRN